MSKLVITCKRCGSENIELKAWVRANDNKWVSDVGDGVFYCPECKCEVETESYEINHTQI